MGAQQNTVHVNAQKRIHNNDVSLSVSRQERYGSSGGNLNILPPLTGGCTAQIRANTKIRVGSTRVCLHIHTHNDNIVMSL